MGCFELHFLSSWLLFLVKHLCLCAGAKTSNPAATNLVWAARPPFAHNDGLRVVAKRLLHSALEAWSSSTSNPRDEASAHHLVTFFFHPSCF
ncbi:hypothetical protein SEVIR_5G290250v4 [Setaria viridis]